MKRAFRRGRYANVTSTLALVVALGGTSYAAVALPKNSVGSVQIKKRGVANSGLAGRATRNVRQPGRPVGGRCQAPSYSRVNRSA
jgi:hypothetical protein